MGAEGAVSILYRKELEAIEDKAKREEQQQKRVKEIAERLELIQCQSVQEFIDPRETRPFLIRALRLLAHRKQEWPVRKHDNIRL
jgi:propionyl-CoA carboxylase beta chain